MLTVLGEHFVEIGRIVPRLKWVAILTFAIFYCGSTLLNSQTLSLDDAIKAAEVNNRSILTSELDRKKAVEEVYVARTQRLPIFSLTVLGSQPLSHLGLTLEKGSLGVYPTVGPIPGRTTTLENPLGVAGIFFCKYR